MKMSAAAAFALPLIGLILVNFTGQCHATLQVGFYKDRCMSADVEMIVSSVIKKNPTFAPALIRLHFHDCFVNGCDASILLNTTSSTERTAPPNQSVRGYDVIDEAKAILEQACEGVVSCADITAMAARDAVELSGGGRYLVETGRRDGLESASNVDLPSPSFSVSQSLQAFNKKGLDLMDMVLLLGGHSIGITHCSHFQDRLYNFQNSEQPDSTMDPALLKNLTLICPKNSTANQPVNLDQNPLSSSILDNSFYNQIILRRGILQIDQELALDPLTNATVARIATSKDFPARFGQAMVKLGAVDVLTGSEGEIRKLCFAPNINNRNFLHF
ncbi:hypothetical protein CRYUN_Cryun25bG0080100 [Craigia yunnanensis]